MDAILTYYLLCGIFASLGMVLILKRRRNRCKRRFWIRPWLRRRDQSSQQTMMTLYRELLYDGDVQEFRATLRMEPMVYENLLALLRKGLTKKHTNFRKPISPETRLAITLRFLALGDCFRSLSQQFRVGLSTSRIIVKETCRVIIKTLQNRYLSTPKTKAEWLKIATDFERKWNFPHCIGAVDGKHIRIVQPLNTGTYFFNYKGYFSTVLLGIADADYKFIYVSIGAEGKASDGGIWQQCSFNQYLNDTNNPLQIPESCAIPGVPMNIPFFLVGDEAFRLGPNLMKKFPGPGDTRKQKIFNYRICRCRRIIENAFGILTCRFRVFRRTLEVSPEFVDDLVLAACILHNYLRIHASNEYIPLIAVDRELEDGTVMPGAWRQEGNLDEIRRDTQRNATSYAKNIRFALSDYFVTADGEIPWQYSRT